MRKLFTFVSLYLAACVLVNASPVGTERARKIAADFMSCSVADIELRYDADLGIRPCSASEPSYFIFNRKDGGFVIVAGDDRLVPVLGYSESGMVQGRGLPSNFIYWLRQIDLAAEFVRSENYPETAAMDARWKGESSPTMKTASASGKLLETATWYQESPYNMYCPTISGEEGQSLTGCVATAIGIVMRYYEWPPCGKGTLPSYSFTASTNKKYTVPSRTLGHAYDYSLMPTGDIDETYGNVKATEEQKKAVATLLYDVGVMVQAQYGYDGTGAYTDDVPNLMNKYMYYQSGASTIYKKYYSTSEWLAIMKAQIDEGMPVLYGGESEDGGHQFILTGYDAADNVYINWGWGGDCNGYFAIDYLYAYKDYEGNLSDVPESSWKFNTNNDAIINLKPDKSVIPTPEDPEETPNSLYLKAGIYNSKYQYYGLHVASGTIAKNSTFTMWAGLIYNYTGSQYKGVFGFYHTDYLGNPKCRMDSNTYSKTISNGSCATVYDIDCSTGMDIVLGDKVLLFYKDSSGNFQPLTEYCKTDGTVGELPMIPMYFIDRNHEKKLLNSTESYSSAEWELNGSETKVTITYPDGTKEIIIQE